MNTIFRHHAIFLALSATLAAIAIPAAAQVDEDAAKRLFKQNDCTKCHAVEKTKKGPSLKKIAAKYREKNLTEKDAVAHMTKGEKVKLEDGTEEEHKVIETKDVKEQTNLARWILSQ
jgi:cytochrome c